jgi:hypothetical protein
MLELGQLVQDLHEVGGAELGGSTRGLDLLRQSHGLFLDHQHDGLNLVRTMAKFNASKSTAAV